MPSILLEWYLEDLAVHFVSNCGVNTMSLGETSKQVCLRAPGTCHVCETHRNTDRGEEIIVGILANNIALMSPFQVFTR